jgi:hypothetical protein
MPNQPCDNRQLQLHPLLGGCLAVSLLWLLALWNLGSTNDAVGSDAGRHDVVAAQDMPLHANSEHSLSLKRFFSRYKNHSESAEGFASAERSNTTGHADSIWSLPAGEFITALSLSVEQQKNVAVSSPCIYLHQLQALNAPRAPPLV